MAERVGRRVAWALAAALNTPVRMKNSTHTHFLSLLVSLSLGVACGEEAADSPADGSVGVGAGSGSTAGGSPGGSSTAASSSTSTASGSGQSAGAVNSGSGGTSTQDTGAAAGTATTPTEAATSDSTADATGTGGDPTSGATADTSDTSMQNAGGAGGASNPVDDGSMAAGGAGGGEPTVDEGMGGMGGSGGMDVVEPGGSTGSDSACGAAGLSFCTDFEVDALPAELEYFPEYQRENIANFVTIDSSASHSGTRSARFAGTEFSQMLGVATPGPTFWGRVYLMSDTDIQNGHNTYVAATDGTGDPNDGEHVRIGEHQCQLEINRKSDDAEQLSNGGEYVCSGGFQMTANTWYCLEFHYDGAGSELQVFVDGTEIPELHNTDWGPYQYSLFKFGFEKYHGDNKNLWYDDLALGSERMGCFD